MKHKDIKIEELIQKLKDASPKSLQDAMNTTPTERPTKKKVVMIVHKLIFAKMKDKGLITKQGKAYLLTDNTNVLVIGIKRKIRIVRYNKKSLLQIPHPFNAHLCHFQGANQ